MSKFPKLPGLSFDGTVYEDEEMGVLEALLPTGGFPTAHAPAMVELPNGDLLACWFAGTYEGSADIHIVSSALRNGDTKWSAVTDLSRDPKKSEQNPSLFLGPDGAVWAMYTAQDDRESGKDSLRRKCAARRALTAEEAGASMRPYFRSPEPFAASRFRFSRTGAGFSPTGSARIRRTDSPEIRQGSASRTIKVRAGSS